MKVTSILSASLAISQTVASPFEKRQGFLGGLVGNVLNGKLQPIKIEVIGTISHIYLL
jgi:hypothetical protein